MTDKTLKIEKAGSAIYNNLNCRMRTAFENDKGEIIYFEFHAGHVYTKNKPDYHYIAISHLFRLDIKRDMMANYSSLLSPFEDSITGQKLEYTEENILYILSILGLNNTSIIYTDYNDYSVHEINGYKLGNADKIIIRG